MKDFHRSFICRSTETGKKGHRSKHHSNKNEICKCYAPFLKLHYYDCPVARKPCPIHGSSHRQCVKDEKAEKKENMVISFHPSSKTDKLFRPVKNLLAHCNPETKINLEYYSSKKSATKDGMKHRQVQTNPQDFKSSLGSSVFVEKSKSFVTDKTNRMKRLKQCFHSPCNSVSKARSEVTLKNKINENFREVPKRAAVATNISKEPADMYLYEKSKWTSSNKLDSSDWEKSSDDKIESDFLTVTKQLENKVIDHKIFEIKHEKMFGDIRFTKLPRQSPFVYSSYDFEKSKNNSADLGIQAEPSKNQKNLEKYSKDNELVKKNTLTKEDISSSEKSQSSSSDSVYFTPLILVPEGMKDDTSDESKYADDMPKEMPKDLDDEVQPAEDKAVHTVNKSAQTETPVLGKTIYEVSSTSDNSTITKISDSDKEPVLLKQEKGVGSGIISDDKYTVYTPEPVESRGTKISRKKTYSSIDFSQTVSKSLDKGTQMTPPNTPANNEYDSFDKEFYNKKEKPKPDSLTVLKEPLEGSDDRTFNSVKVQVDSIQKREVSLVYDRIKNVADKLTQTALVVTRNVEVETMATKKNKSQMTYCTVTKSVQTSFTLSDSQSQEGECVNSESRVNFVATSYESPDTPRDVNKSPWKKSHSDGELYNEQKGDSTTENLISIHHVCLCENSETSNSESDYNSYEKINKSEKTVFEQKNSRPVIQNQNDSRSNAVRKDVTSKGEQTCLSDLSELARMVDQFFSKMSKEAFKSCECEKIKKRESKVSQGVHADSFKSIKKNKTGMVDAEVQTTFKVKVEFSSEEDKTKENICQSVNAKNVGETIFLCEMCRRKLSTVVVHTSTTTDSLEKASKKEIIFNTVGTSTDNLDVEKRSIGVCVSGYNLVNCFVKGQQLCVSEGVFTNDQSAASATKNSLCETKSFFLADCNNQTGKEWSMNITNIKCPGASDKSAPKEERVDDPDKAPVKQESTVINQITEKKIIKKPRHSDTWKSANYSLLSETFERRTVPKPSDASKAKPGKSGIPTAAGSPRKGINFKNEEPEIPKLNTQVIFTQGVNKQTFKCQKDSNAPKISFNRNTVCICTDHLGNSNGKPPIPKAKTEASTSSRTAKAYDQKPPLPTKQQQQPGGSNPRPNNNTPTQAPPKKPQGPKKSVVLPAIIRPIWYKDFRKTLQMIKNCRGHYLHDSKSSLLKQKRFWEEEDDSPGGKKIKGRDDGSGESYELEQSFFTSNGRQTFDLRNGFLWFPSSAQQIPKADTQPKYLLKATQSESKVPRAVLQNSALFKGFNKRTNVLSVRSCRLKPVQVNENHPFRKLFECRLCKSLNFLKTNQKYNLQNEQPSEGSFGYEPSKAKDENLQDENAEPPNWGFSSEREEEFLVEYSFSSDSSGSADLSESSDFVDDSHEGKIERVESSFLSPPDARKVDTFSNAPYGSKSFDTFWFGRDSRKK